MQINNNLASFNQELEFNNLQNKYLDQFLDDFKQQILQKDEEIRNSSWRKQQGYCINGYVERTILTSTGPIKFKRTKYKIKIKGRWKTKYLVDDYFQFKKYEKLSFEFQLKILEKIASGMEPRNIIESFPRAKINKSTISRLIKKLDVSNLNSIDFYENYKIPKNSLNYDTIYISTDDAFLKLKRKDKSTGKFSSYKYRVRLAILYQGISEIPDSRNSILINKRIIPVLTKLKNGDKNKSKSTLKFSNLITTKIKEFYGDKNWKIVVSGDGDQYIKSVAEELHGQIVLDWFHLKAKLRKVFHFNKYKNNSADYYLFDVISKNLFNDWKLTVDKYLIPLMKTGEIDFDKTKDLIRYIKSNSKGIENYKKDYYIGSFTESNIYHFVKSISNGKSYSFQMFQNLLALRSSFINCLKPIDIWKNKKAEENNINIFRNKYFGENNRKNIKEFYKNTDMPIQKAKTVRYKKWIDAHKK